MDGFVQWASEWDPAGSNSLKPPPQAESPPLQTGYDDEDLFPSRTQSPFWPPRSPQSITRDILMDLCCITALLGANIRHSSLDVKEEERAAARAPPGS